MQPLQQLVVLRGFSGWQRVRLLWRLVAKATVSFGPGRAVVAVAAPAAAGDDCDCGWGLCGSCCCWRPLRLIAGAAATAAYTSCGSGCWRRVRLRLLPLQLAAITTVALADGGCGCQCNT